MLLTRNTVSIRLSFLSCLLPEFIRRLYSFLFPRNTLSRSPVLRTACRIFSSNSFVQGKFILLNVSSRSQQSDNTMLAEGPTRHGCRFWTVCVRPSTPFTEAFSKILSQTRKWSECASQRDGCKAQARSAETEGNAGDGSTIDALSCSSVLRTAWRIFSSNSFVQGKFILLNVSAFPRSARTPLFALLPVSLRTV